MCIAPKFDQLIFELRYLVAVGLRSKILRQSCMLSGAEPNTIMDTELNWTQLKMSSLPPLVQTQFYVLSNASCDCNGVVLLFRNLYILRDGFPHVSSANFYIYPAVWEWMKVKFSLWGFKLLHSSQISNIIITLINLLDNLADGGRLCKIK